MFSALIAATSLASVALAQQVGTESAEQAPPITYETCTTSGGCTTVNASIVLDAQWRWIHTEPDLVTCDPNGFNATICPDEATCAANCYIEGVSLDGYNTSYGTTTSGNALHMLFGSQGGQRLYLLDESGNYTNFQVLGKEFTFDIDISNVPCGYNAALYFSEMQLDGGLGTLNKAGAKYGTGYCDSQCSTGTYFFDDRVNYDATLGTCCNEMDIWEANFMSTQITPHPCNITGNVPCTGTQCKELCDPSGCDYNPFRMGNPSYYGAGLEVNTNSVFTVVTQFITDDGTPTGTLSEIRRIYVQNGVVIQNAPVKLSGLPDVNSLSEAYCTDKIDVLGDAASFNTYGGLSQMGESLSRSAVLIFALWDSLGSGMDWLDGLEGSDASTPGALRGNCTDAEAVLDAAASVTFSNIKIGELNSTYPVGGSGSSTTTTSKSSSTTTTSKSTTKSTSTSTSSAAGATQTHYGQCGGVGWSGPTVCASGYTCQEQNTYYSQCL